MEDRERWDRRHTQRLGEELPPPDPQVLRALELVPASGGRRALDLACGRGRHALELAARGWSVAAWDVSGVALEELAALAATRGLAIETRRVDLTDEIAAGTVEGFDLVVLVSYLDRDLHARLARLLRPGGHAILATFTLERPGDRPPDDFCLRPGELASGLPGLETVWSQESGGRATILARRDGS